VSYLHEEPSGISGIIPSVISTIKKVRYKTTMADDSSKLNNGVFGFFEETCCQEETSEGDEGISSPTTRVACREVSKTRCHCVLVVIELSRRDSSPHLDYTKG